MTKRVAPGVEPPRRLNAHQHRRAAPDLARENDLLLVAARKRARRRAGARRAIANSAMRSCALPLDGSGVEPDRAEGGSANARSARLSAMLMSATRLVAAAVRRNVGKAGGSARGEPQSVTSVPSTRRRRARGAPVRRRSRASSAWPLPSTPASASISPARAEKLTSRSASCRPRRPRGDRRRPGARGRARARCVAPAADVAADHHVRELRAAVPATVVRPETSPSRRTTTSSQREHLAELVRDEDDRAALALSLRITPIRRRPPAGKGSRSARREPGAGAAQERLDDLDPLSRAERKGSTRASGSRPRP